VTATTPRVPIVDFAQFLAGSSDGKQHVVQAMRDACEGTGFLYFGNHGVSRSAIEVIFAASRRFLALPLDERMKVRRAVGPDRGYQPLGSRIHVDKADAPDLNESFKYQHELPANDPDVGNRVHAVSRWPDDLPGWRETLLGHRARMERLADALLRVHYPPHPSATPGRQFGLYPHSETTAFTILAQGEVGGLQVEHDGGPIDVPPIPGTFVVNIGDMTARWTNERFASTPHRVINRSGIERYSVAFFAIPDFDAEVAGLPSCMSTDNPPKYPRCMSARSC